MQSTVLVLLRRRGSFVVTPKEGAAGRQPRAVAPALVALAVLLGAAAYGLLRNQDPATLNNVAFAALHMSVLLAGVLPALRAEPLALPVAGAPPAAVRSRSRERARGAVAA